MQQQRVFRDIAQRGKTSLGWFGSMVSHCIW
ncbi:MAG: hypothetical protein JOZ51_07775 [Chloroflexi bacterium]|nr:hypothetical protein [Chloroflexota bacterium]